jgi:hypothetical protein
MKYFLLEPEVAGHLGDNAVVDERTKPPIAKHFHFEFDGWNGDDLITAAGLYLGTKRLADFLRAQQPPLSGIEFGQVELSKSPEYYWMQSREMAGAPKELPEFVWLKITGVAGVDDFGTPKEYGITVSERVLKLLEAVCMKVCVIKDFGSTSPASK